MGKTVKNQSHKELYENIKALLYEARNAVTRNINTAMVMTYFEIGRMIVEHEQKGAKRAEYAKETLKLLSQKLTDEFDRGFSVDNLQRMRIFFLMYKKYATVSRISAAQISQTASAKSPADQKSGTLSRISPIFFQLSRSHYVFLMRLEKEDECHVLLH